jgi:hypothetical protein
MNFYNEVYKRKDELLEDLRTLCQIPSVFDPSTAKDNQPFGEANRKTVVYTDKVYRITGGSEPYDEDSPEAYTMDEIKQLVNAYKQADADRLEASKVTVDEAPAEPAKAMRGLISDSLI